MDPIRQRFHVRGAVQGVGFRPFVHALANKHNLSGWVQNTATGVLIEVEGPSDAVTSFERRLTSNAPPQARITSIDLHQVEPLGETTFEIRESDSGDIPAAQIQPDLSICSDCRREIQDPSNRRFKYPFTNCTHCGPRFSIVERIPYDRANTSMKEFTMCPECEAEYRDPENRRFHAQPNACPECGPQLWVTNRGGNLLATSDDAIVAAVSALNSGQIVAAKGIGGFHLLVDARNEAAVKLLRERKQRDKKPFAMMHPTIEAIAEDCEVSPSERELLQSSAAPIVLLKRRSGAEVRGAIAPGNPYLGVMLPYSPMHHLLLVELGRPVVATSGNLSEEPICFTNEHALKDLGGIADLFLLHDRAIVRPMDDSVVQVVAGREMVIRRSRGYAPAPIPVEGDGILAVGADLKNSVAWLRDGFAYLSQHLGDLGTEHSINAHTAMMRDLPHLYPGEIQRVACDLHPDYFSTHQVEDRHSISVQHHHAHIAACRAEHRISQPCVGVAFDGTGYGTDGTIWGGEFLRVDDNGCDRCNWLRTFPLPGGGKAIRDPRFCALGLLHEIGREAEATKLLTIPAKELKIAQSLLRANTNCPRTSSMGRLFDAIASLLGLCSFNTFEGEAAMSLEFSAMGLLENEYPFNEGRPIDWKPMLEAVLKDIHDKVDCGRIAGRFHAWVVSMIAQIAASIGEKTVVLSGGCFQNRILLEAAIERLQSDGIEVFWPQQMPPNDGGIALGQAVIAAQTKLAVSAVEPNKEPRTKNA